MLRAAIIVIAGAVFIAGLVFTLHNISNGIQAFQKQKGLKNKLKFQFSEAYFELLGWHLIGMFFMGLSLYVWFLLDAVH